MTRRIFMVGCVVVFAAALVSACGAVVPGSPRVVGDGPPVHGRPVSSLDRAELEIAAAVRSIDPCVVLNERALGRFGDVIAHGPVGDLSTCHAEIVSPGASPVTPVWVEVSLGVLEPRAEMGAVETVAGTEVRGAAVTIPGSCALYFPLAPYLSVAHADSDATKRWGYVSYLGPGPSVCADARVVTESVLAVLESGDAVADEQAGERAIPLSEQDPCRVVEILETHALTFGPGARPYECRISAGNGSEASVGFALTPMPAVSPGGLDEVELGGRRILHFQDAMFCNYYFYPGEVFDNNDPSSPAGERVKSANRLTAVVNASAPSCDDAELLATAAVDMYDY